MVMATLNNDAPPKIDYMIPSEGRISMSDNWGRRLLDNELDTGCMRPYLENGRSYITRNMMDQYGKPSPKAILTNDDSNATLRFLDWIQLDEAVLTASKPSLRVAKDLQEAGLVYQLPNGIAKTTMQYQQQSDISGATVSMDGLRQGERDRPVFSLINFPIPIIHKDFSYSLREILASRTGYSPLDTTTAELAGRRVAEQVEQFCLGCGPNTNFSAPGQFLGQSSYAYAGSVIYGLMNYPGRITYSITLPTAMGWTPATTVSDVLAMRKKSKLAFHNGPWILYHGLAWDSYMDDDYKPTYNDESLRQRIQKIDGIQAVRSAEYIPDYSLLLVQQTSNVIRLVIGMQMTTVQWESHGGMQWNFKVMAVIVPQLRSDFYGNTGIVHGNG